MDTLSFGRADLHMHTTASDGVYPISDVLDHVERRAELDVIAITDHDRVDAALWAVEHQHEYSFEIVPGTEVSSAEGHVLGLWVTTPIPTGLSLVETAAAIHEQGGVAILAHPFFVQVCVVATSFMRYVRRPEMLRETGLDAIEVLNAGSTLPGANAAARALARRVGMTAVGNSDAHTLGGIGSGATRFRGSTAADLRRAIAEGTTIAEGSSWPMIDYWIYLRSSTRNTSNEFSAESLPSNRPTQP